MNVAAFLQGLGALVAGCIAISVAVVIIRLIATAAHHQWTKHSRLKARVSAIEQTLFGPQHQKRKSLRFTEFDVSYTIGTDGLYEQLEKARHDVRRVDETLDRLNKRVRELESYRPASIENPEDLR